MMRTGYRDQRAEAETKEDVVVPWTRMGVGQRDKRQSDLKHMSRVEVTGSADGLDMKCERRKTRIPDLLS